MDFSSPALYPKQRFNLYGAKLNNLPAEMTDLCLIRDQTFSNHHV